MPVEANVSIVIYDVAGRVTRVLRNGKARPGSYSTVWDGATADHRRVAAGVYILKVKAGTYTATHKLVQTE